MEKNLRFNQMLKKVMLISVLLAGILLFDKSTEVQAATLCKYGDVDNNGKIDVTDLLKVQRHISVAIGETPYEDHPDWLLEDQAYTAADVNADGRINDTDIQLIQEHIVSEKGGQARLIVTVTLFDTGFKDAYDCFPVIYDLKNPSGCHYPELGNLSEDGYVFDGWYTDAAGGKKVDSYSAVTKKNDHTLYARWTPCQYQLFFDANGGNCSVAGRQVAYQAKYGSLPKPTKAGYTFEGWYTAANGGEQVTSQTKMSMADTTIFAHWKIMTGITLNQTNITIYVGKKYQLRATVTGEGGA